MVDRFKKNLLVMAVIYTLIGLGAVFFTTLSFTPKAPPLKEAEVTTPEKEPEAAKETVEETPEIPEETEIQPPAQAPEEEVTETAPTEEAVEEKIVEESTEEEIIDEEPDEELEKTVLTEEEEVEVEKKIAEKTSTVNGKYYTFSTTNRYKQLNVRVAPGVQSKSIAHLSPGSKGVILEYGDEWSKIQTYGGTISGYCINEYLVLKEVSYETYKKAVHNSGI